MKNSYLLPSCENFENKALMYVIENFILNPDIVSILTSAHDVCNKKLFTATICSNHRINTQMFLVINTNSVVMWREFWE